MSIWSGRFAGKLHPDALVFSSSLSFDRRLAEEDIEGSIAHAVMLGDQNIIPPREARAIRNGLLAVLKEIQEGTFPFPDASSGDGRFIAEDIHMAIEHRLIEKIGDVGGKLHTARSRNDQVALDERLYLRKAITGIREEIRSLQRVLVAQARANEKVMMPGYTHLQRAQPALLSHLLLAFVEMFERDIQRSLDAYKRVDKVPLGAGALAGTSFPIDRNKVARLLKFSGILENSVDAVSDRDVLIEFLSACAITMMHLSRLAEEIVLWSSREFDFVRLGDEFTTGSSIMPQKKNPDMAELVRGKTGRVYGDLVALLTVMKGLPLAYNRDMQEDKEPLFDAADTTQQSLHIMSLMVASMKFRADRFEEELRSDPLVATELADDLVRKGMPFRKAHALVGQLVLTSIEKGIPLARLSLEEFQKVAPEFGVNVHELLDPRRSLNRKQSAGSTSPKEVAKALAAWEKRLSKKSP
jgi:argininosuccinate lyase